MGTIFETIQSISADHPKTPPEVVKMGEKFLYFMLSLNFFFRDINDIFRSFI